MITVEGSVSKNWDNTWAFVAIRTENGDITHHFVGECKKRIQAREALKHWKKVLFELPQG